jgi:ribosome maturation factor RimP
MSLAKMTTRLSDDFTPILHDIGLDLEELTLQRAGKRQIVRILVDKDGGVTLDEVAAVTKLLSAELDRSNAMGENPYVLEVSSPGVERALTEVRHWRRNLGRLVRIVYVAANDPFVGRIEQVLPTAVVLSTDELGDVMEIEYSAMGKAVIQVELNSPKSTGPTEKGQI